MIKFIYGTKGLLFSPLFLCLLTCDFQDDKVIIKFLVSTI